MAVFGPIMLANIVSKVQYIVVFAMTVNRMPMLLGGV